MIVSFEETRDKWFKNPAFLKEYEALESEFYLARQLMDARSNAGLSRHELARRMGTSQSTGARLESGYKPSIKSLELYAEAVGMKLEIRLAPL